VGEVLNLKDMGKRKYIETPEKMWELDLPKNKDGNYIIIPKKKNYSGVSSVNKSKFPNGYIYFIRCSNTDFYKIGVSKNPKRRICDIDSYLPFDLEILSLHFFKDVYDIEKEISNKIKLYNIRREWYLLDMEKAKEIMIELYNLNLLNNASN
jgi:predicted GIY-YIG superfamily endonuclease